MTVAIPANRGRLAELLFYFLRLGLLGFGGPVALVGQMERELVGERAWLTKEQMREAIAICQSLPGPLAIQVGIYAAFLRGGFWGAWVGGWAFIFPNFVIVAALGALYVYFGDLKPVTAIFYGVGPAVIALILHSCYRLAKLGMEDWLQWLIAIVCLAVTVHPAGRGRVVVSRRRVCRHPLLWQRLATTSAGSFANRVAAVALTDGANRLRLDSCEASIVLSQGRGAHVRQRARHCAISRARRGQAVWVDGRTPIPDRGCGRYDQSRSGGDYRNICWLPCCRLLGVAGIDRRHFSAVVRSRPGRGAAARASPLQS
jgi:chromate transport protein ChrA